jgi:D-alanine-D-alanine ligase
MNRQESIQASGYRIAVLCGGESSEREVSLVSGRAVEGAVHALGLPCDRFALEQNRLPGALDPARHLVLPIIHGSYGEDGRLSAELDAGGFAYAGCDQASSVLCFDKLVSKAIAARLGIPVARDVLIFPHKIPEYGELTEALGDALILKPRRDGSSVGLHLVRTEAEFKAAASGLARMDYIAEAYMEGYDLTVGILDGKALGVVGVHPEGGLYDYAHKYTQGMSRYDVPAQIDEGLKDQLSAWSCRLFKACGCRDLARVDYRISSKGAVIFLEINTLPGMTPTSLLPKTAQLAGLDFGALVLQWIGFAHDRAGRSTES